MAQRGLGTLTLDLLVKVGGFKQGMDEAARKAEREMRAIAEAAKRTSGSVSQSFGSIGGSAKLTAQQINQAFLAISGAGQKQLLDMLANPSLHESMQRLGKESKSVGTTITQSFKGAEGAAKGFANQLQFTEAQLAKYAAQAQQIVKGQQNLFQRAQESIANLALVRLAAPDVLSQEKYRKALKETATAYLESTRSGQAFNKMVEEGRRLTEANVGAQERFIARVKALNKLAQTTDVQGKPLITPEVRLAEIEKARKVRNDELGITAEQNRLDKEAARIKQSLVTPQQEYNAAVALHIELVRLEKITQAEANAENARLKKILDASNPALQRFNELMQQGAAIAAKQVTPLQQWRQEVRQVIEIANAARAAGKTSIGGVGVDEFQAKALADLKKRLEDLNGVTKENNRIEAEAARLKAANITAQERYDQAIADSAALIGKAGFTQADHNRELARQKAILDAANPALQEHARLMEAGARATQQHMTAAERRDAEIAHATKLLNTYDTTLKRASISQETFNRMVAKAHADYARASQGVEKMTASFFSFSKLVQRGFGLQSLAAQVISIYAVINAFRTLLKTADDLALMENRLSLVTDGAEDLAATQEALFQVAQRTRKEYLATADLYVRLAQAQADLGASQRDMLLFTEAVGNALTISGTSAERARGVLIQLSQGLATGTFRAEEFNSVLEGAPELIRVAARNIERFGGSVGALRNAVREGKLESVQFFEAILAGQKELAEQAQRMPVTISQAWTQLKNVIVRGVSDANMEPLTKAIHQITTMIMDPQFQKDVAAFVELMLKLAGAGLQIAGTIVRAMEEFADNARLIKESLATSDPKAFFGDTMLELEVALRRQQALLAEIERDPKGINAIGVDPKKVEADIAFIIGKIRMMQSELGRRPRPLAQVRTRELDENLSKIDTQAQKDAEKARESILKQIEALEQQRAVLGKTAAQTMAYRIQFGDLREEFAKAGPEFDQYKQKLINLAAALEQATAVDSITKEIEALTDQAATLNMTEEAAFEYSLTHGKLADQLELTGKAQAGLTEEYRRAWKELQRQKDIKTITQGMQEVEKRLLELQGKTAEAAALASKNQYKDLTEALKRQIAFGQSASRPIPVKAEASQAVKVLDDVKGRMAELAKGVVIPITVNKPGAGTAAESIQETAGAAERLKTELSTPVKFQVDTSDAAVLFRWLDALNKKIASLEVGIDTSRFERQRQEVIQKLGKLSPVLVGIAELERQRQAIMAKFTGASKAELAALLKQLEEVNKKISALRITVDTAPAVAAVQEAKAKISEPTVMQVTADTSQVQQAVDKAKEVSKNVAIQIPAATSQEATAALETQRASIEALAAQYGYTAEQVKNFSDEQVKALYKTALATVEATAALEGLIAQAEQLTKNFERTREEFSRQEQTIQARVEVGLLSEIGARRELIALHRKQAAELQKLRDSYVEILKAARAQGFELPELAKQIRDLHTEILDLLTSVDTLAKTIADAFEEGLGSALKELVKGTKTLGEAASDFLNSITDAIIDWGVEQVVAQLRDILSKALAEAMSGGLEEVVITAQRIPTPGAAAATPAAALQTAATQLQTAGTTLETATTQMQTAVQTFQTGTQPIVTAAPTLLDAAKALIDAAAKLHECYCNGGNEGEDVIKVGAKAGQAIAELMNRGGMASGGPLNVLGGGELRGPGTPTSDSMFLMGSTKEFMVQAKAAQQPGGPQFLDAYNRGAITVKDIRAGLESIGRLPRFAGGGSLAAANASMVNSPALRAGNGPTQIINQYLTVNAQGGNVSRQTEMQLTAAAARGVRLADRRNN